MKITLRALLLALLAGFLTCGLFALPKPRKAQDNNPATTSQTTTGDQDQLRLEGEQRFRTNCGRCHMAPHKFPPRMMATIVRHMRVRATITDDDMRIILHYMTQ
jgi:mono/diheme cytochrome c family protein